jgi:hypothetical protein
MSSVHEHDPVDLSVGVHLGEHTQRSCDRYDSFGSRLVVLT